MNKLVLLLFFFFCASLSAQDTLSINKKDKSPYTEKDILVDDSVFTATPFNRNFKEKYRSNEFQYEVKVAEKGAWDRFKEWLAHWLKQLFGWSNGVSQNAVNITFKVVATIIVLYVVYLIAKVILNKEGQWIFGKSVTKKIISHEDIERNLQHVDFEKLIASTLKSGNQRLVIRYYYLWILRRLSEKELIDWNPEKTNSDYFYEIKNEALKQDFSYASYLYNYIWYGEFEITEANFETIKKTFEKLLQSIK